MPNTKNRKIQWDVARVALHNHEWRLALALLIWPSGWSHTRLETHELKGKETHKL